MTIVPHIMLSALAATRDEVEFVTEFRHVPEGWMAVAWLAVLAGVGWAVVWMYAHEGRIGASARVRSGLAVIRCLVFLLLAAIVLEPVRVRILRRWVDSYTLLLVDESSSMDLADRYRDEAATRLEQVLTSPTQEPVRRASVVSRLLQGNDRAFLHALAQNNRIKLYTFSDEPTLRGTIYAAREAGRRNPGAQQASAAAGDPALRSDAFITVDQAAVELSALGPATNIERAVHRSMGSAGSAPIAAVVVLSDGGFNQGATAEETARFARERQVPIHVVAIGDPSPPQNVRVTELLGPSNAFQKDPFALTARLAADGLDGQTVRVQLRERNAAGGASEQVVDRRDARVGPGGAIDPVVFQRAQTAVGRFVYTVEAELLENEAVSDDNNQQTSVNVIDARTRVLLVSGGPTWDYSFVSRLLTRDHSFDVSCWLQSADAAAVRDGTTIIDHLPATPEELFEYDVVVLMDADKDELTDTWCRLVDTLVTEHGGGLLVTAARPHTPDLMRDQTLKVLRDLLPVSLDPDADLLLNQIGHFQLAPSPLSIPTTAYAHPTMKLAEDPSATQRLWESIGQVYWHFPVLREKPLATVLLRHGHPRMRNTFGEHVLLATQFVGSGRTGYLGFDGTWRWRRDSVETFDRFWVQLLRYLAEGRLLGGTSRVMLMTDAEQYSVGQAVMMTARLLDSFYQPLRADQVRAEYTVDGERGELVLTARPDRPGWFEGRFVPHRTGNYRLMVPASAAGGAGASGPIGRDAGPVGREIRVVRPNLEMLRPQTDVGKLRALAEASAGGRYFEIDQWPELTKLIPDLHEEIPIRSRPVTLWDNSFTLSLLLALLTVEWGVRKWKRLL